MFTAKFLLFMITQTPEKKEMFLSPSKFSDSWIRANSEQTVQTQIRLLLQNQSDQDLYCLQYCLQLLNELLHDTCRAPFDCI